MTLELFGMWSPLSFPSLPGPFLPEVVAPNRALSMGKILLSNIYLLLLLFLFVFSIPALVSGFSVEFQ